jgi:hypothetical protein
MQSHSEDFKAERHKKNQKIICEIFLITRKIPSSPPAAAQFPQSLLEVLFVCASGIIAQSEFQIYHFYPMILCGA